MDFIAFKKIIKEEWESKPKESWFNIFKNLIK
jgi:glycopeptide antibiotics resistance protein